MSIVTLDTRAVERMLAERRDELRANADNDDDEERPVVHGGSREGAGRPAETTDGGTLERKSVTLDATTVRTLKAFGDGELSNGIRRAARLVARKGGRSALPDS
jgi:hypothetical protein